MARGWYVGTSNYRGYELVQWAAAIEIWNAQELITTARNIEDAESIVDEWLDAP